MMTRQTVSSALRLHIAIAGRCNAGKSSLLNFLTGQQAAIVSDRPGTTTDPVRKAAELPGLGAVTLTDTPGLGDRSELGAARVGAAVSALEGADVVLIAVAADGVDDIEDELALVDRLRSAGKRVVAVLTKADLSADADSAARQLGERLECECAAVSAQSLTGHDALLTLLARSVPADFGSRTLLGSLVIPGCTVMLVMPQDAQAPKGRLIMPQVQTIRELIDRQCIPVICTPDTMERALAGLIAPPSLVITDSQVFGAVAALTPPESRLTSFSVLMAAYKGDAALFAEGARAVAGLGPHARILIAEACTHAPASEDIGRVKLPRMLRKRLGEEIHIEVVGGTDFPDDLSRYDLVVHCGGCMFSRAAVMARVNRARAAGIPVTNYGILIAWLTGILDRVTLP